MATSTTASPTPRKRGGLLRSVNVREVSNGSVYYTETGGAWHYLPHDLPSWGPSMVAIAGRPFDWHARPTPLSGVSRSLYTGSLALQPLVVPVRSHGGLHANDSG